jgi:hypothetical protein
LISLFSFLIKAAYFEQQNCTTKVAQQKYSSKTAQTYREKLHQAAIKAQRNFGTKVTKEIRQKNIRVVKIYILEFPPKRTPNPFFHAFASMNLLKLRLLHL